jgi:hypothetical protein
MGLNLLNLNVSFAVIYLNGSVGAILISVSLVINAKMKVTMYPGMRDHAYLNV